MFGRSSAMFGRSSVMFGRSTAEPRPNHASFFSGPVWLPQIDEFEVHHEKMQSSVTHPPIDINQFRLQNHRHFWKLQVTMIPSIPLGRLCVFRNLVTCVTLTYCTCCHHDQNGL